MSLIGAQCVGAAGRVIAFEPPFVDILRYHKRVNWLKQMEVVVSAVSDMDRESFPFSVMNNGFSVGNSLVAHELEGPTRESAVRTLTLDSYCSQNACWPDVVKIDVEGTEMPVLKGARAVLSQKKPKLIVAVHPPWLPAGKRLLRYSI
jgi:FkbM family methyltransferase